MAWRLEAIRSLIMRSRPELTKDMATTTSQKYLYKNEKIRKALGFDFIPVEESVKKTCRLFLEDQQKN
jgi:hypothetical protein